MGAAAEVRAVRLTGLRLTDFRNYAGARLDVAAAVTVLVGDNGAGKTNLLEAISCLSPGRGLRRAQMKDIARIGGSGGFAVSADVDGAVGPVRIGVGMIAGEAGRQIRVDGEPQKTSDVLSDHLRVMWLTPAMDGLFTDPAADRRRFLDRLVLTLDPAHGRRVLAYEQALTARNRLLEDLRTDPAWLDATEIQIAELGVAVAAARRDTVAALCRQIAASAAEDAFPPVALALDGDIERALAGADPATDAVSASGAAAAEVEEHWIRDLAASRSRDRAAGRTLTGPHRSDLVVHHAGKAMPAALSSTGEQKALLIGLVLAHARLVRDLSAIAPVLLLDEVAAHLDPSRRHALARRLADLDCQAFLTGTDAEMFSDFADAQVVRADGGRLIGS